MTTAKAKTLIEKLVEVAQAVRYIEKGGKNQAQNYKFVGEAQVVEKVAPKLLELGVLVMPKHQVVGSPQVFTTAKGSVQFLTTVQTDWTFTDGVDSITATTIGQGTDAGDKGAYKAMTGAKKYGLLQALMIATGDDPEEARADEEPEETGPKKASQSQLGKMFAMAKEAGIDLNTDEGKQTLQAIVFAATNKRSSKQLLATDMDIVFETLSSKAEDLVAA